MDDEQYYKISAYTVVIAFTVIFLMGSYCIVASFVSLKRNKKLHSKTKTLYTKLLLILIIDQLVGECFLWYLGYVYGLLFVCRIFVLKFLSCDYEKAFQWTFCIYGLHFGE